MAKAKKKSWGWRYFFIIIVLLAGFAIYKVFGPATGGVTADVFLYVRTGSDYEQLKTNIKKHGIISDMFTFDAVARAAGLPGHIHAGKYRIDAFMSIYSLVRKLHAGRQEQVKLVINKLRTKQDFINLISTNLEADSIEVRQLLSDKDFLSQFGLDSNTVMCAVVPNTYFFKWNTSADKAFKKIAENYSRFWDDQHTQQAQQLGLTPVSATIIASIVDEETNLRDDKPNIASVYINRIKKGMKLQADPTVKFAIGNFAIRRVTGPMLQTNSPYNTYMYPGLPPGPICTPAVSSLQAVLDAPKTTYLYFCAKDNLDGSTIFASTFGEQIKNAHAYQKALDARGIH